MQIGEPFAPEQAVMAHPIKQGVEALGPCTIEDIAPLGPLGDEPGDFERLEMLGNRALRDAAGAREIEDRDLLGAAQAFIDRAPGPVNMAGRRGCSARPVPRAAARLNCAGDPDRKPWKKSVTYAGSDRNSASVQGQYCFLPQWR